jgi:hypothetical protein
MELVRAEVEVSTAAAFALHRIKFVRPAVDVDTTLAVAAKAAETGECITSNGANG